MKYDVETSELKPWWTLEFKSLTQIAYLGNPDILDSFDSTLLAYKNCYTGPRYLLSCFLPLSFPLSKKDQRQMVRGNMNDFVGAFYKTSAHLLRLNRLTQKKWKKNLNLHKYLKSDLDFEEGMKIPEKVFRFIKAGSFVDSVNIF